MGFLSEESFDELDGIEKAQRLVSILLYISLISHGLEIFLADMGWLEGLVPALQMISAVTAILYFLAQCLILPPLGVLIMTVVAGILYFVVPYFLAFLLGLLAGSLLLVIVGGVIMALSVGLVITVVDGVIVGAVITPLITAPYLMGFGAMGASLLAGAAVGAGVDAGVNQVRTADLLRPLRVVINLLLVLVLVWPALTWLNVFQGMFALKPVNRAQQEYRHFQEENTSYSYQRFFEPQEDYSYTLNGTKNWTFDDGFYDSYIYPGRNSFAQGATPGAATNNTLAFCLNGMVYLVDVEANELYHVTAYRAKREDAMVMVGKEVFLFSDDRILLMGPGGRYLWENTQWTSDLNGLSDQARYDRLYAILEAQNDGKAGEIPIEDVAAVAYAQRNGLLLYYDGQNHCAYFGRQDKKGQITVLRQSASGTCEEVTAFTPNCDSDNLPYTMINATVVAYIDEDKIVFQGVGEDWSNVHYTNKSHDGKQHPFISFHVTHDGKGNEYFAYQDSEDILCIELLGNSVMETTFDAGKYDGVYTYGNYVMGIKYDSDNLINRITYFRDRREGQRIMDVWTEDWRWDYVHLNEGVWGIEEPEETEPTIPWEERPFLERYPTPGLRTSVGQIGLYKDNVISPSQYRYYKGPANKFFFYYPPILYEKVEYLYSEDGTEVLLRFYCEDDPSTLTVTLRPNTDGADHSALLAELQKAAEAEMINVKRVRSGYADEEQTASMFYLTGNDADTGMINTRLCRVNSEYIMEMELLMPKATDNEDRARKDYYAQAMYDCCGFGSGEEPPVWRKFKGKYGL